MTNTNMMGMDNVLSSQMQELVYDSGIDISSIGTIKAIDDIRYGRNVSRAFSSVEELMEELNAED